MTTLNRVESNKKPQYKDYVAFLENYRGAKKDDQTSESGYSVSLTNSSNNSSASVNSDLLNEHNCVKRTVKSELVIEIKDTSHGFQPIHKVFEITDGTLNNRHAGNVSAMSKKFEDDKNNKNQTTNGNGGGLIPRETIGKKNSIGELSKKFEHNANHKIDDNMRNGCTRRSASIEAVSKVFQNNDHTKSITKHFNTTPKPFIHGEVATKPTIKPVIYTPINNSKPAITSPKPSLCVSPQIKSFETQFHETNGESLPPLPPPLPPQQHVHTVPVPPPFPTKIIASPKIIRKQEITSNNGNSTVNHNGPNNVCNGSSVVDGIHTNGDLKKDPRVKKMVYGALREMYGAYHDKANDYIATIPKNRVKKNNGLDNIINSIASQGGLDKLSGRANPSAENEVN